MWVLVRVVSTDRLRQSRPLAHSMTGGLTRVRGAVRAVYTIGSLVVANIDKVERMAFAVSAP